MKIHLLKLSTICFAIFVFMSGTNFAQAQSESGGAAAPTVIEPSDSGSEGGDPEPRPEPQANNEPEPVYTQSKVWWKNIYVDVMFAFDIPFNRNGVDFGFSFIFLRPGYKFIEFGRNMALSGEIEMGYTWFNPTTTGLNFGDFTEFTMLFGTRFFYEVIDRLTIEPNVGLGFTRWSNCVGIFCGSGTVFAFKFGANVQYQLLEFLSVGGGIQFKLGSGNNFAGVGSRTAFDMLIEFGASYRW